MGGQAGVYAFRESLYSSRGYASGGAVQYAPAGAGYSGSSVAGGNTTSIKVDMHGVPISDAHIGDVVASKVAYRLRGK
jgi:hypothetical protein